MGSGRGIGACVNFEVEAGEQCDDGNIINNDGCSDTCQIELGGLTQVFWTGNFDDDFDNVANWSDAAGTVLTTLPTGPDYALIFENASSTNATYKEQVHAGGGFAAFVRDENLPLILNIDQQVMPVGNECFEINQIILGQRITIDVFGDFRGQKCLQVTDQIVLRGGSMSVPTILQAGGTMSFSSGSFISGFQVRSWLLIIALSLFRI